MIKIEISKRAKKELKKLDFVTQERILKALVKLSENPYEANIEKLQTKKDEWKLRVGDWRIFINPNFKEKIINVIKIKNRREAYKQRQI